MARLQKALRPYYPLPVPLELDGVLGTYLEQELKKIGDALDPLISNYRPNLLAQLNQPTQPEAVTGLPQPITNWTGITNTWQVDKLAITIDPITGVYSLGGAGDQDTGLRFWAHVVLNVANLAQNNSVSLYMNAGGVRRLIATAYKTDLQTEEVTLGGAYLLETLNDSDVFLEIDATADFTASYIDGAFGLEFVFGLVKE